MKILGNPNSSPRQGCDPGFALVVTLTLMVLLSILALGLLSLSSVSLRTLARTDAGAASRANALLALQLAIGDLQANLGPDKRVSATGSVRGASVAQARITGVWESNKLGPGSTASDFSNKPFVKWLVSGPDQAQLKTEAFADQTPGAGNDVIDLMSSENLEAGAPAVSARKVKLSGKTPGAYAYAVIDEGVKARINMGVTRQGGELAEKSTNLGGGERPNLSGVAGFSEIPESQVDLTSEAGRSRIAKMVSMRTSELSYGVQRGDLVRKSHDFTNYSVGVLADVADGGLKTDLNLLAETQNGGTLPGEYAAKGIYEMELGAGPTPDPSWSLALGWANIFNTDAISSRNVGGIDLPTARASAPSNWEAGRGVQGSSTSSGSATLSGIEPPGAVLLPSVAKVQVGFAIAARDMYLYPEGGPVPEDTSFTNPRDIHSPQGDWFRRDLNDPEKKAFNSPVDYMLNLIYTPIITLHNPYNVPLEFENLRVEIVNVPFAVQIFRKRNSALQTDSNFVAQTKELVPFSLMGDASSDRGTNKRFGLLMTDTLLPGEVKIYTPDINPDKTWLAEVSAAGKKFNFDFTDYVDQSAEDGRSTINKKADTSRATATVGWNGQGVGYSISGLCKEPDKNGKVTIKFGSDTVGTHRINRGVNIPLQLNDQIYAEFAPVPDPELPEKKFSVEMTLDWEPGVKARSSAYVFEYSDYSDIRAATTDGNPQVIDKDAGRIRAPKNSDSWFVSQLHDHSTVALKNMKGVKPIALFSAYAKTGMSGNLASGNEGEDGLYPAKPFAFQNQSAIAVNQDMANGNAANYSQEIAISRFPEAGIGLQLDTGRGKFLSGHTEDNGRHFGSLFELPLAPFQSLVSLNSAQLAAGTKLPHFFAPVGNSNAHPLMSGTSPVESGTGYADHSFLLNAALFDRYYLSGIQRHANSGRGGDGRTAEELGSEFIATADPQADTASPLPDPRLRAYIPDGKVAAEAITALQGDDGYKLAAAHQLVEGAFNVNSTSVAAWKAMISSMTGDGGQVLEIPETVSTATTISEAALSQKADVKGARFSRMRLPNGQPDREDVDGFWRGPIDISEAQLDALATEIVEQVKRRGPFLSVAEFVNRQIGDAQNDDLAFSGAVQAAIDSTDINTGISAAAEAGYVIEEDAASGLNLATPKALAGESTQGAPGFLTQADILAVLGNTVTVRSDTFVIRAYGEALDESGNIVSRSFCEAVVQRFPEYVDSRDSAETPIDSLTSTANQTFGRRFEILSLRWLSPSEI